MSHPPSEEDPRSRTARRQPGIATSVVDGHQDHHRAADDVDRLEAAAAAWRARGANDGFVVDHVIPCTRLWDQLDLCFDLDREIEWQLGEPDGASRVGAGFGTVQLEDQV